MEADDSEREGRLPAFLCDAMLGGLARWLRAAGYEAEFDAHWQDGALVRQAVRRGRVLLTSDAGILERFAVTEGIARCVFIPHGLSVTEQLAHVLGELHLPLRAPRCMGCGGELVPVALEEVRQEVPEKVRRCCREFFRCARCGKVFWRGTHWRGIRQRLERAARLALRHGAGR